jgi:hypothetical protein
VNGDVITFGIDALGIANMRTFLLACVTAAVIATAAAVILYRFQEPAAVAFSTSAVRL